MRKRIFNQCILLINKTSIMVGGQAVINGVTGYHVNPFDIDDFSEKTLNILHNLDLSHSMSNKSKKEFSRRFTLEKCVKQYLELLF